MVPRAEACLDGRCLPLCRGPSKIQARRSTRAVTGQSGPARPLRGRFGGNSMHSHFSMLRTPLPSRQMSPASHSASVEMTRHPIFPLLAPSRGHHTQRHRCRLAPWTKLPVRVDRAAHTLASNQQGAQQRQVGGPMPGRSHLRLRRRSMLKVSRRAFHEVGSRQVPVFSRLPLQHHPVATVATNHMNTTKG